MSTMTDHWPIIATIIAVLNAWAIFWLKWYLDKKTNATATPATNELKATKGVKLKWRWFIYLVNFLGTAVSLNTFQLAWNLRPVTGPMTVATVLAAALLICVQMLPWVTPRASTIPALEPKMLKRFGVLWDKDQNPHCPVDEKLMAFFSHGIISDHPCDYLVCPACDKTIPLFDSILNGLTLFSAKQHIRNDAQRGFFSD